MNMFFIYDNNFISQVVNATLVPNKGDTIIVRGRIFKVKNVVWHMENPIQIEIQLER
jgi:hypothetical protein